MIRTRAEGVELLRRRIEESGLSTGRFAVDVLWRQPRTVRRWVSDESPIPELVLDKLETPTVAPWPVPAMEDVPTFDREKLAEECGEEVARELQARMRRSGVCDVCGRPS